MIDPGPTRHHPGNASTQRRRRVAGFAALALLVLAASLGPGAQADPAFDRHAGLVIQFGDNISHTACVDLGPDGQATGEEVLQAAGFPLLMEYSALGVAVCKIDAQGCDYPAESCWCQCQGSPCIYWAYHHLVDGQWQYSGYGASTYIVQPGAVEGWAWGEGTSGLGAQPPLIGFDEICVQAPATATPTATASTVPPTAPAATATTAPTEAPTPTAIASSNEPSLPTFTPTWTPQPAAPAQPPTSPPTATPTATVITPSPPPSPAATPTVPPSTEPRSWTGQAYLPLGLSGDAQPAEDPQPSPTATPTPQPTRPVAVAALSGASDPPAAAGDRQTAAGVPAALPRLRASASPDAAQSSSVTTARADYAALAGLILLLSGLLGARRLRRPGPLALPRRRIRPSPAVRWSRSRGFPATSALIYGLTVAIGVVAFLYPFLAPALGAPGHANDGPLLLALLVGLCFLALLYEVQSYQVSAKLIALLGVLVSINAVLRFVEVGIPGPGGFSPIFALIILTGYVFGGRFGFTMGALTLLVSGLITGGVGPWLPAQMFVAGWVGLSAPLLRPLVRLGGGGAGSRRELALLVLFAGLWGLLFGLLMNLWFWPFMAGPATQSWQAGLGLGDAVRRYAAFYLATSLLWDTLRALGNGLLILAFGAATLRALRRFHGRFEFQYQPEPAGLATPAAGSIQ